MDGKPKSKGNASPPPFGRDVLQLKRENLEGIEPEGREKKVKFETLNLSLLLNASIPAAPAVSARTENYSMSKANDQIWYAGEGTNGSVHSRFRPVGDGSTITFENTNNEFKNNGNNGHDGLYRATSSDSTSFFPSELPARMGKAPGAESGRPRTSILSRPGQVLEEIVSESASFMPQLLQELRRESLKALKGCLRNIRIQRRLERRSALTVEALSRANKVQLEILVAVKRGKFVSFQ